ncbi:hypothetical protein PIROE2DRAFT_61950 [Piromyces sp. E2]|nr:hypothetical protein PIROE2DRAFT_61950 [Piromyces sp. E2]|eukprot:OUM62366.1 hypothetical protein PIROE2DRAFT_61950 [Piromyces sp. E2]
MAESYDAYYPDTGEKNSGVKVYFRDNSSCWYNDYFFQEGCCINKGEVEKVYSIFRSGEKWNHCIDVKKGNKVTDARLVLYYYNEFKCNPNESVLQIDLVNTKAHCINTGCLTRYGWFNKGAIASQRKC